MPATYLLHQLMSSSADRWPDRAAVTSNGETSTYGDMAERVAAFASSLVRLGLAPSERVAVYLDKRLETVVSCFGTSAAGGAFVPVNPVLKAEQVGYILRDCNVRVLVTSPERLEAVEGALGHCHDLRQVVVTGTSPPTGDLRTYAVHPWSEMTGSPGSGGHRRVDTDMVAILYTSGSTGRPKGVVLSHRNMVAGAKAVAEYLENGPEDTLLAALPLSFDAGFSQLTTAFHVGARVALLNYLVPRDVLKAIDHEKVTGLTAVPPLWIQLSSLEWPASIGRHLRYIANTGGRLPREALVRLRRQLPNTRPFLMYGLTEAFRATYLPPELVDERPDSIGKAIPNAEVLVLREDGTPCAPHEPGELVQRGALVALGYWNDPEQTAKRFRPLPVSVPGRESGLVLPEIAVFSGDTVRQDEDGYLYFIGRRDEMIKTSGYRVSPTEIEEVLYATQMVGECAAFGVPHDVLGQAVCVVVTPVGDASLEVRELLADCRVRMPAYMVPAHVAVQPGPLPRNANGKIDRVALAEEWRRGRTAPGP